MVASEFPQVGLVQFALGDPVLIPPGVLLIYFANHAKISQESRVVRSSASLQVARKVIPPAAVRVHNRLHNSEPMEASGRLEVFDAVGRLPLDWMGYCLMPNYIRSLVRESVVNRLR